MAELLPEHQSKFFRLPWTVQWAQATPPTSPPPLPTPTPTPTQNSTPTQQPPTTTTTTQNPIPPTSAQRPTTTQNPIPPVPTRQLPTTTTQNPIPPTPVLRPPTTTTTTTTTQSPIPPSPAQRPPTTTRNLIPPSPSQRPPTTTTEDPIPSTPAQMPPNTAPTTAIQNTIPPIPAQRPPTTTQNSIPPSPTQRPPTTTTQTPIPSTPALRPPTTTTQTPILPTPTTQRPPTTNTQPLAPLTSAQRPPATTQTPIPPIPTQRPSTTTQTLIPSAPRPPTTITTQIPNSPNPTQSPFSRPLGLTPSQPPPPPTSEGDSVDRPSSSRTIQEIGQDTPPPSVNNPQPLVSEKEEPKIIPPPLESQESLSKTKTETTIETPSNTHNTYKPLETKTTTQPNVLVPTDMPHTTKNSNSISSNSDHAVLRDKPEAKNVPQEKTTNSIVERREIKEKTDDELISEYSKSKAETMEKPSFLVQEDHTAEKYPSSISKVKHPMNSISPPVDKSSLSESRQRPITSNGAQIPLHKEIKDDISRFTQKMTTTHPKKPMGENPMSVITITGENRGAFMHIGSETDKKEGAIHIRRGYKINPDESGDTADGEGSSRGRRKLKESNTEEYNASKAYVNNNTQGVNNSIVFNSSITQGNPGVHLSITRYLPEPNKPDKNKESLEARKAEYNVTPAERLTYQPTVRRRCLRGLLLESSDSDDDNPEKPRRHGCRYGCEKKSTDGEIDVL